jgi:hypothetical protein
MVPHSSDTSRLALLTEGNRMYDMKPDRVGWTVYDVETGRAAVLDDLVLIELDHGAADELVVLLNRSVYAQRPKRLSHWPLLPSAARRDAGRFPSVR